MLHLTPFERRRADRPSIASEDGHNRFDFHAVDLWTRPTVEGSIEKLKKDRDPVAWVGTRWGQLLLLTGVLDLDGPPLVVGIFLPV